MSEYTESEKKELGKLETKLNQAQRALDNLSPNDPPYTYYLKRWIDADNAVKAWKIERIEKKLGI